MKQFPFVLLSLMLCMSAGAQEPVPASKGVMYGAGTSLELSIPVTELPVRLTDNSFTGKVTGVVTEVCQEKGCWMKIRRENSAPMMVKFKDYAFFMPKNIVGQTVVMDGVASVKETSVEQLRHYAEDAGKTKSEIRKIKKPKIDIQFVASGVQVL